MVPDTEADRSALLRYCLKLRTRGRAIMRNNAGNVRMARMGSLIGSAHSMHAL
jgi:hypothetical protein